MTKEEFIQELKKLNINISCDILIKLDKYYHLLITENEKYNLTNITEESSVYLKHFYDSLTITKAINLDNQKILDVGSGAGFPGLVLKIVFPNIKIDLLDSTAKRCNFLKQVIEELSLNDINVINARAEDYAKENREKYDIVTSRAVAPLKHLLEYSIPMLKINGYFITLKSNLTDELININNYYKKLHLEEPITYEFTLPKEKSLRTIYKIKKVAKTDIIYPRQYSQIKKKDL